MAPQGSWQHSSFSLRSAIRSICSKAVANSAAGSFSRRVSESGQDFLLGAALHRHDEGDREFFLVAVVEVGEALGVPSSLNRSSPAEACSFVESAVRRPAWQPGGPPRSGWARIRSRFCVFGARSEGRDHQAVQVFGRSRCRRGYRHHKAASAIQGECSKTPPKRATKASRFRLVARAAHGLWCLSCQWRAMSMRRGVPDRFMGLHVVEEAGERHRPPGPPGEATVQPDGEHLGRARLGPRHRAGRRSPSGRRRTGRPQLKPWGVAKRMSLLSSV